METLTRASNQWATRPADQRFTSLVRMLEHFRTLRSNSRALAVSSRALLAAPTAADDVAVVGPDGNAVGVTHWSFGQLAGLGGAPAGYLRTLPAPLAADCINYGLKVKRDVQDVGVLLTKGDAGPYLRAATGPNYGRIWNADIVEGLVRRFGDGFSGDFRVPGIFGTALSEVTKENTTLYASDRDMFVFLADEEHRIEVPNRRHGQPGALARGFFIWNSEVGSATLGIGTFLFDYVCENRIVWGASGYQEVTIRHTAGAPDRYIEQVAPALEQYARSSSAGIQKLLTDARARTIGDDEAVTKFLRDRFSKGVVEAVQNAHIMEEGRPIETLWDAATGITAYAKTVAHQDARVGLEREAGKVLRLAA